MMREFIDAIQLTESVLPKFSCWIKADGSIIVSPQPEYFWHGEEAKKHFPDYPDAMGAAFRAGWIRHNAAGHYFDLQFDEGVVTSEAVKEAISLVRNVTVEITYNVDDADDQRIKVSQSQNNILIYLNQMMRKKGRNLTEAKHLGGVFYTSVTPRDLIRMASDKDLRGCAVDDKVYVWSAMNETHYGARGDLGLPQCDEDNYGFDFYCWNKNTEGEEDRNEWVSEFKEPPFSVGDISISDSSLSDPLDNRGFAFMVGKPQNTSALTESTTTLKVDEIKFWYSSVENRFVDHREDNHHVKIVAQEPEIFGLSDEDVSHHPHANGDYGDDEIDEDGNSQDGEEWADNNDMGLFSQAFFLGWVRGGHEIDIMKYWHDGEIRHEGMIFLEGDSQKSLRRCVSACLKRWPDIKGFRIESGQRYFELNIETTRAYIKFGTIPDASN